MKTVHLIFNGFSEFSGGSLLLAGRAGMGRREAASLVANMHQMPVFSPKLTSSYGIKQFRNDLKTVYNLSS